MVSYWHSDSRWNNYPSVPSARHTSREDDTPQPNEPKTAQRILPHEAQQSDQKNNNPPNIIFDPDSAQRRRPCRIAMSSTPPEAILTVYTRLSLYVLPSTRLPSAPEWTAKQTLGS